MALAILHNGGFQDAAGNALENGTLVWELSQDAQLPDSSGQVSSGQKITTQLDANGNAVLSPPQGLWPTDSMNPVGVSYTATGYSAAGQLVWGPTYGITIPTQATYDLDNLVPSFVGVVTNLGGIVLQTSSVNNVNQAKLNLHSSDNTVALTDDGEGDINLSASGSALTYVFNPLAYGALGDGTHDDQPGVQAAITAASVSGGIVYFPDGFTFLVKSLETSTDIFTVSGGGVSFDGSGIIKVDDSIGSYRHMFNFTGTPTDVFFRTITIDNNGANNPVNSDPTGINEHNVFEFSAGSNVLFDGVTFLNGNEVQSIAANLVDYLIIRNCKWLNYGVGSTFDHDSSLIYANGADKEITGNVFQAAGLGCRTAIEAHTNNTVISNNVIELFRNGIIISAETALAKNMVISGNTMLNVYQGIQLWATDGNWQSVSVVGNTVFQNRNGFWSVTENESCIGTFVTSTHTFNALTLTGNAVSAITDAFAANSYVGGIAIVMDGGSGTINGLEISGNSIEAALTVGINVLVDTAVNGANISNNTILNPGIGTNAGINGVFKTGILLQNTGVWNGLTVVGNTITDTKTTPTMKNGIYWVGVANDNAANQMIGRNTVRYNPAATPNKYIGGQTTAPFIQMEIPNWSATDLFSSAFAPYGSTIFDPIIGKWYLQTNSTQEVWIPNALLGDTWVWGANAGGRIALFNSNQDTGGYVHIESGVSADQFKGFLFLDKDGNVQTELSTGPTGIFDITSGTGLSAKAVLLGLANGVLTICTGVTNDDGNALGFKHNRVTTGTIPSGSGTVTVSFAASFSDANYTVNCTVLDSGGHLSVVCVTAQSAGAFTVKISNSDSSSHAGTLNWTCVHD